MRGSTQSDLGRLEHIQGYAFLRDDLKLSIETYAARQDQLSSQVREEHSETRTHIDAGLRHAQQSVEAHISAEVGQIPVTAALESQREQLLNSLRYSSMNERRNHVSDSHEDTFHWVLRSEREEDDESLVAFDERPDFPDFVGWLESEQQRYWISGKPGSGKSTLMKFIIEHPKTRQALDKWAPESVILSHYFWKPGGGLQCSIKGLWCTLACQCLSHDEALTDYVLSQLPISRDKREPSDWSIKAMEEICLAALAQSSRSFCIFIDGLDEIDDREGIPALKAAVSKLLNHLGSKLKLCLASRSEPEIRRWLWDWPELRLHQLTHRDAQALVDSKLGDFYLKAEHADTMESQIMVNHLRKQLVDKAEGVFIWLIFALQSVVRGFEAGDSLDELLDRVDRMSAEIDDLYDEMWARIEPVYRQKATLLLRHATATQNGYPFNTLVCFTMASACEGSDELFRPGARVGSDRLKELRQQCSRTQQDIETRCGGLLEVGNFEEVTDNPYVKKVTFIHRTAYDHLMTSLSGIQILAFDESVWLDTALRAFRSMCALRSFWPLLDEGKECPPYFKPNYLIVQESMKHFERICGKACLWRLLQMVVNIDANAEQPFREPLSLTPKEKAAAILGYFTTHHLTDWIPSLSDPVFHSVLAEGLGLDTPTIASAALRHAVLDARSPHEMASTAMNLLHLGADASEKGLVLTAMGVPKYGDYPETQSGCALELLLQSRLAERMCSTGTREEFFQFISLLDSMIVSERSLAQWTVFGLLDKRPTPLTSLAHLWKVLSDASRPSFDASYEIKMDPIFRGTLSHLMYSVLFQQELPEPEAPASKRLQNIYNNSNQKPARLVGILVRCATLVQNHAYGYTLASPDEMFSPLLLVVPEMWHDSSHAISEVEYPRQFGQLSEEKDKSERAERGSRIGNFIEEAVKKGVLVPNTRNISVSELFAEDYVASEHE